MPPHFEKSIRVQLTICSMVMGSLQILGVSPYINQFYSTQNTVELWWSPPQLSVYLFIGCICFLSLSSVNIPLSPSLFQCHTQGSLLSSYSGFPLVFLLRLPLLSSCSGFPLVFLLRLPSCLLTQASLLSLEDLFMLLL